MRLKTVILLTGTDSYIIIKSNRERGEMNMKSKIKVMLLGVALVLVVIYLRVIFIGNLYSSFIEVIWTVFPIIGFAVILYGFFSEDPDKDLTEKIYSILSEMKLKDEKVLICKKCGKEYKETQTSCTWCEHKEE